jgi:hypothetical protein
MAVAPLSAQSRRVDNGAAALQGFAFYWETQLNPPTPPLADGSFFSTYDAANGQVHRMLLDRVRRVYFGYTVQVESQAGRTFRLSFQPLTLTKQLTNRLGDDPSSWKPLPSTKFPAPQVIRSGDVLELNLLANNTWGQQLTEYVTVQETSRPQGFFSLDVLSGASRDFSFAAGPPRDFSVNDVILRLRDPRVFINGRFEESSARTLGEDAGGVVWIYIPTRGRFLLSILPNTKQGFRRAGEIRGNSVRFTIGKDTFNVTSGSPIAPGLSAYNAYVLHQPDWRPTYPNANIDLITIGAADRVEYVVTNK